MAVEIDPRDDLRAANEKVAKKILDDAAAFFESERIRVRDEVEREMRGQD